MSTKTFTFVEDYRLTLYEMDGLKQIMEEVQSNVIVETVKVTEDGTVTIL